MCRGCEARLACLTGALERREPWGVWGGELLMRGSGGTKKGGIPLRRIHKFVAIGGSAALLTLTLTPAEIFGVADRLGSIDKGKIANLVVTKCDMFLDGTKVQFVMIDGNKFEPVPEAAPADAPVSAQEVH